jgi:hypothetical protein
VKYSDIIKSAVCWRWSDRVRKAGRRLDSEHSEEDGHTHGAVHLGDGSFGSNERDHVYASEVIELSLLLRIQ